MSFKRWIYILPLRWRSVFDRNRLDNELEEELRDHVARLTEAYHASGLTPDQTQRAGACGDGRHPTAQGGVPLEPGIALRFE